MVLAIHNLFPRKKKCFESGFQNGKWELRTEISGIKYFEKSRQVLVNPSLRQKSNIFRLTTLNKENDLDEVYGYNEPSEPGKYTGWLVNMHTGDTLRIVSDNFNNAWKHWRLTSCIFPTT